MIKDYQSKKTKGRVQPFTPVEYGVELKVQVYDESGDATVKTVGTTNSTHLQTLIDDKQRVIALAQQSLATLQAELKDLQDLRRDVAAFEAQQQPKQQVKK